MDAAEVVIHEVERDRVRQAAEAHGIELSVCACKNADLARGSCNIAGTWAKRSPRPVQPLLIE